MLSLPGAPNDDPGLVLAGARRLARNGQIAESVVAFRQRRPCWTIRSSAGAARWNAARRPSGCRRQRIPPMPAGTENATNSTMLRLSLELRQVSRQVRDPYFSPRPLTRGLALLLAGDLAAASRELRGTDPGSRPAAAAWEPLAERLTARLIDLMIEPDEVVAGQVEEIMLSADVQGWPWLSRIARGLQAAMLLAAAPAPWRVSAAAELLDDLERGGDRWTVCLTSLAIGAVYARIDRPDLATRTLRRTEEVAAALGAPVLGAWASVLRTAVAVRQGAPGAEAEAAGVQRGAAGLGLNHAAEAAELIRQVRQTAPGPARAEQFDGPRSSLGSPGVSLRCLGGFSLAVAGAELPWRDLRPRVRALLMLLAMNHGRQLHREQLVDALWPDSTLSSGIRSLQVAVSSIRQCLCSAGVTEDALRRHGDAYALQLPGVSDQLADFERLAHAAGREQGSEALRSRLSALDRYAGDLLPEVGPAEWVVDERNRLRLLAASVGSAAARDALAAGERAEPPWTRPERSVAPRPVPRLVLATCGGDQPNSSEGSRSAARSASAGAGPGLGRTSPGSAPGVADRRSVARRS
jgi:hypothetical protein